MSGHAFRSFISGDVVAEPSNESNGRSFSGGGEAILRSLRSSIIGAYDAVPTPLGPRRVTYVDHTATGRAVASIEAYVAETVLPVYGNTHTTSSYVGYQSHLFLSEARDIIRDSVRAHDRDDVVLFTGRGATAASNVLVHHVTRDSRSRRLPPTAAKHQCPFVGCGRLFLSQIDCVLHARKHPDGEQAAADIIAVRNVDIADHITSQPLPVADSSAPSAVVIVGPYAHHSTFLPWREAGALLYFAPEHERCGGLDVDALVSLLSSSACVATSQGVPLVVIVTAASNVTGALCDVDAAAAVAHAYGAICVVDAAAYLPHAPVVMNPGRRMSVREALATQAVVPEPPVEAEQRDHPAGSFSCCLDAAYFSPHKLLGGPSSPGVLVLKRRLLQGTLPLHPGGGSVFFVHADGTPRYLANDAEREEAGSPDTIAACRGALAMRLVAAVGYDVISERESAMAAAIRSAFASHPLIRILGTDAPHGARSPVVTFVVLASVCKSTNMNDTAAEVPASPLLHHWGFIAALLNDVWGLQSRGGCLCAGPHFQSLLGIEAEGARRLEAALVAKDELLRPGGVRISVPFYASHAELRFVIDAVLWVATHASSLIHLYTPVRESGEWRVNRSAMTAALADARRAAMAAGGEAKRDAQSAADVIRRAGGGDGAGLLAAAARGATTAPPRRWLSALTFGGRDANGLHHGVEAPKYRMVLNVADDDAVDEDVDDSVVGIEAAQKFPTESELFDAYRIEANLLLRAVHARVEATVGEYAATLGVAEAIRTAWVALAPMQHAPAALLSAAGIDLRWFALSGVSESQLPTNPLVRASQLSVWHDGAAVPILPKHSAYASPSCLAAWASPHPRLAILAAASKLTPQQEHLWNAGAPPPPQTSQLHRACASQCRPSSEVAATSTPHRPKTIADRADVSLHRVGSITAVACDSITSALPLRITDGIVAATGVASRISAALPDGAPVTLNPATSLAPPVASVSVLPRGGGSAVPGRLTAEQRIARSARIRTSSAALRAMPPAPPAILRGLTAAIGRACAEFNMIREGDRLLVGLSGGKDSMSLLTLLLSLQARAPVNFEVAAATVDPQYPGFDPSPLRAWCASLGVPYFYESQPVIATAATCMVGGSSDSICAWCSRMKRGILYSAARREKYNVLVLGQHADDFAESFIMSATRNGVLRTMKAAYTNDAGDVRIIRPLVFARERLTRAYAAARALPIIAENCPACYTPAEERYRVKTLLAGQEAINATLFDSLLKAMRPLMTSEGAMAVTGGRNSDKVNTDTRGNNAEDDD